MAVIVVAVLLLAGYIWLCRRFVDPLALAVDRLIGRLLDRRRADIDSRTEGP